MQCLPSESVFLGTSFGSKRFERRAAVERPERGSGRGERVRDTCSCPEESRPRFFYPLSLCPYPLSGHDHGFFARFLSSHVHAHDHGSFFHALEFFFLSGLEPSSPPGNARTMSPSAAEPQPRTFRKDNSPQRRRVHRGFFTLILSVLCVPPR